MITGIYSVVMFQKERHAYSVSFFLGFAGRGPAPPFGDSNARDGRAIPPPRFCLRQNARTPQKRRGPEGPLGKISRWQIENLKYLNCSALPARRKRYIACDEFFISFQNASRAHFAAPRFQTGPAAAGLRFGAAAARQFFLVAREYRFQPSLPDGHYTSTCFFKGGFAVRVWL